MADEENKKIVSELTAAQLWLVYQPAFFPAIKEAVTAGFQPDITSATPAKVIEMRFWAGLLEKAFTVALERGAELGVAAVNETLTRKLAAMFPPRDANEAAPAHASREVLTRFPREPSMTAGELIRCLRNNHENKDVRGIIGDMTCGELLAALSKEGRHRCNSFYQCTDCSLLDCIECGGHVQPNDVEGVHTIREQDVYHCGCVESESERASESVH